jgi:hypothetical protein
LISNKRGHVVAATVDEFVRNAKQVNYQKKQKKNKKTHIPLEFYLRLID